MAVEIVDAPAKTELAKRQPIDWDLLREQALASFEIQRDEIEKEVAADTQLLVTDDNTRKAAKERHWCWVKRRTALDRTRKAATADAQAIVKLVKDVSGSFQAIFNQAEQHLAGQLDAWDAEIERKEREAADSLFNARNSQLLHVGIVLQRVVVESLTDNDIDRMISEKIETDRLREAESKRLAAEKAEAARVAAEKAEYLRKQQEELAEQRAAFAKEQAAAHAERERVAQIEADKLAFERAELARQKSQLADEQRQIDEEKSRLANNAAERQRQVEQEASQKELAERTRLETEQRLAREAEEARQKAESEDAARLRAAALQPDREKLLAFADALEDMRVPAVADELTSVRVICVSIVADAAQAIRELVAREN